MATALDRLTVVMLETLLEDGSGGSQMCTGKYRALSLCNSGTLTPLLVVNFEAARLKATSWSDWV